MTGQREAKSMLGSITLCLEHVEVKQRDALYWGARLLKRPTFAPLKLPLHSIARLEFQEATLFSCGYLRIVAFGEASARNEHISFRIKNGVMFGFWEQGPFERLKEILEAVLAPIPPAVLSPATVSPHTAAPYVELLDVTMLDVLLLEVPRVDDTLVEA